MNNLSEVVHAEVREYLDETGGSQQDIQEARRTLRAYRLGRAARTSWEQAQIATVRIADQALKSQLSVTLEKNSIRRRGKINESV